MQERLFKSSFSNKAVAAGLFLAVFGVSFLFVASNEKERSSLGTRESGSISEAPGLEGEARRWRQRIDEVGSLQAYEEFKKEYSPKEFGVQHLAAHIMGELLYENEGIGGLTVCDSTFAFGCYHSFFARAIAENGEEAVKGLDRACLEEYGPLGTGCQHGIGHGILEHLGHERLTEALETCALTTQPNELFGCTSGVFMEYNFPILIGADTAVARTRNLESDPHEPCRSIVPRKFRKSCYFEVPQWWETVYNRGYQKLGQLCQEIEDEELRETCLLGVGNVSAPMSKYSVEETREKCREMPNEASEILCLAGASWSFFAAPEQRSKVSLVCTALSEESKQLCIQKSDLIGNEEIFNYNIPIE